MKNLLSLTVSIAGATALSLPGLAQSQIPSGGALTPSNSVPTSPTVLGTTTPGTTLPGTTTPSTTFPDTTAPRTTTPGTTVPNTSPRTIPPSNGSVITPSGGSGGVNRPFNGSTFPQGTTVYPQGSSQGVPTYPSTAPGGTLNTTPIR